MSDVKITIGQTGAEQAAAGVKQLENATRNAEQAGKAHGESMASTMHHAHRAEKALGGLERAMGETSAGMSGMGAGLRLLTAAFRSFMMAGPQALIMVLVMLVATITQKVLGAMEEMKKKTEDATKAALEHVESMKKMDAEKLTKIKDEYKTLKDDINDVTAAADRMDAAHMKMLGAQERLKIAGVEAKGKADIAALDTSSPLYDESKKAIEDRVVRERADIEISFADQKASMELESAKRKLADVLTEQAAAEQTQGRFRQQMDRLEKERVALASDMAATDPGDIVKITANIERAKALRSSSSQAYTDWENAGRHAGTFFSKVNAAGLDVQAAGMGMESAGLEGAGKSLGLVAEDRMTYQKDAGVVAALDQANAQNAALTAAVLKFAQATVDRHAAAAAKIEDLSRNSNMGSN